MTEEGIVREIRNDVTVIGCARSGGCKNCSSTFCSAAEESRYEAINPHRLPVEPGDVVQIEISPGRTIAASFSVLIFPLILFIAAFAAVSVLAPQTGEAVRTLFGIAGLAVGFAVTYLMSRRRARTHMPVISAVRSKRPDKGYPDVSDRTPSDR